MAHTGNTIRHEQRGPEPVTVHTVKDEALAELLRTAPATPGENRLTHLLHIAASPAQGSHNTSVRLLARDAELLAPVIARRLAQAREAQHPAADLLADLLAQLGFTEDAPAPAADKAAPSLT